MVDDVGRRGEEKAALWLQQKGWRILKKNFRTRRGEVDIIGEDGKDLVFVEVKCWRTLDIASLEYGIGISKQQRIAHAARVYLARNTALAAKPIRFDVVYLHRLAGDPVHVTNAFETPWD